MFSVLVTWNISHCECRDAQATPKSCIWAPVSSLIALTLNQWREKVWSCVLNGEQGARKLLGFILGVLSSSLCGPGLLLGLQFSQPSKPFASGETLNIPLGSVGSQQNKCFCAWVSTFWYQAFWCQCVVHVTYPEWKEMRLHEKWEWISGFLTALCKLRRRKLMRCN